MKINLIVLLFILSCATTLAQSAKKEPNRENSRNNRREEVDRGATYGLETTKVKKTKLKRSVAKDFDKKIEEFEKRMELNAKKNEKMEKELKKPQYSDPTYFGHKHKPKKRPPGKKKYCKECGMYH